MKLYEKFPDSIAVDGVVYKLRLYFDRVLRYMDASLGEELTTEELADVGFEWLVASPKNVPLQVKEQVLERIFSEIITPPRRRLQNGKKPKKAVDFTVDAAEIYASFMRDYGIDLDKQRGKMHWCAFIALFQGLSEDTPIKSIMDIRVRDIPAPDKHNAEEIRRLTELKTLYALPEEQSASECQNSWNALFDMMLKKANDS